MSLSAALSSAVSGLTAQSLALSAISENIANSSTTAYKTKDTSFAAMVTGAANSSTSTAGVKAYTSQNLLAQGLIQSSATSTNLALDGEGFFVVASSSDSRPAEYVYTRSGDFSTDSEGYLVNGEGYVLLGYATDAQGNITTSNANDLSGLEPISVSSITGTAKATTEVSLSANLPADAAIGDSFSSTIEIIDSVGVSHTMALNWTKTGENAWQLDVADPYATDTGIESGDLSTASFAITFDGNGVLASISPSTDISVQNLTSGAGDSTFTLDLGEVGATSGLTQFAATGANPDIEISNVVQDGARYGQLSSISIDKDGLVTANFDNGISRAIYQIPIATFANAAGLQHVSGSIYDESVAAGTLNLSLPGEGSAGAIEASALEGSTTDIATEFNKMIIAQQAYSAAAQIVSAADDMFQTLVQAVR